MSWFSVDVEMNGPAPGLFSMVSLGAVKVDKELKTTFFGQFAPLDGASVDPRTYDVIGVTEKEHKKYPEPGMEMLRFYEWIKANTKGRPIFISDNPSGDFAFVNWYFWKYLNENPFGWSARRISDLYCGFTNDIYGKWRHLRKTEHTHNPVDDAMGNAEALLAMQEMGLNLQIK